MSASSWQSLRRSQRRVVLCLAVALLGSALLADAPRALAAGEHPASPARQGYARIERACRLPSPGRPECYALGRIPVAAGTADATPYTLDDGASSSGPSGGLTPAQLASAYEYNPTGSGAGQTIALIDAYGDPNIEKDLGTFDSHYGIAACTTANGCFKKVGQSGSTTELPPNDTNGWSIETTLDVETAHAVCQLCKILLVEANDQEASLSEAVDEAVALGATEVSNSYGLAEESPYLQTDYDHPGVVITASTGDDGYFDWDEVNKKNPPQLPNAPNSPATFPAVVAVGGTSLTLNENGTRASETVWNNNGPADKRGLENKTAEGATGGGCSTLFTADPWQRDVANWSATGCGTKRLAADVAAVGNPNTGFDIYDDYNCGKYCEEHHYAEGWETWGGTSLSSPIIAALYALAGGSGGVSDPAATLYGHFGQAASFYDVTEGGNGFCDGAPEDACGKPNTTYGEKVDCEGTTACNAAPGFDGPTGVGAPKGLGVFKPLSVATKAADLITQSSATMKAVINPHGEGVTECTFEYGTTTAYGSTKPCAKLPGSGESPVAVYGRLKGLAAGTTYHFRISTDFGTLVGADKTFHTRATAR